MSTSWLMWATCDSCDAAENACPPPDSWCIATSAIAVSKAITTPSFLHHAVDVTYSVYHSNVGSTCDVWSRSGCSQRTARNKCLAIPTSDHTSDQANPENPVSLVSIGQEACSLGVDSKSYILRKYSVLPGLDLLSITVRECTSGLNRLTEFLES